ncbi:MAG: hypothetical protein AAF960_29885, partial [Bacteroidota bacterium]
MALALFIILKFSGVDYKVIITDAYHLVEVISEPNVLPFKFIFIDKKQKEWYYVNQGFEYRLKVKILNRIPTENSWIANSKAYLTHNLVHKDSNSRFTQI